MNLEGLSRAILSSAFVRQNGVSPVSDLLRTNSQKITVFAGIRNGITSAQGLLALLDCKVRLFVVDTGAASAIFHPKVYLAVSEKSAHAIIGSANLTHSGLNQNIEASSFLILDRTHPDDEKFLQDLLSANSTLESGFPKHVFQITQKKDIAGLLKQGRIDDEDYDRPSRSNRIRAGAHRDKLGKMRLYGKVHKPPLKRKKKKKRISTEWELLWISKGLTERDLNIPSGSTTHATGSMLFKKGQFDHIDQRSYFRKEVFAELVWKKDTTKSKRHLERTSADFEIIIKRVSCGIFSLKMTHNSRTDTRAYEQRNAMTGIHWGNAKSVIAQKDLLGRELRLYRKVDSSSFVIEID